MIMTHFVRHQISLYIITQVVKQTHGDNPKSPIMENSVNNKHPERDKGNVYMRVCADCLSIA